MSGGETVLRGRERGGVLGVWVGVGLRERVAREGGSVGVSLDEVGWDWERIGAGGMGRGEGDWGCTFGFAGGWHAGQRNVPVIFGIGCLVAGV